MDYKTRKKGAKRVLVFLLAFMMLVMQIPATVWAQEDTGVKSVSSPDAEDYGSGKITDNTVSGPDLPGADAEAQDVSGNLLMKLKAGAQAGETTYYVDAQNGDDNNDGKSEEKAFRSLDKVNEMTFLPGDRILLKKGCIWNGQLKPGGNGTEELPIIISSYGEGSRPVINGNGTGASLTESDNRSESMEFLRLGAAGEPVLLGDFRPGGYQQRGGVQLQPFRHPYFFQYRIQPGAYLCQGLLYP